MFYILSIFLKNAEKNLTFIFQIMKISDQLCLRSISWIHISFYSLNTHQLSRGRWLRASSVRSSSQQGFDNVLLMFAKDNNPHPDTQMLTGLLSASGCQVQQPAMSTPAHPSPGHTCSASIGISNLKGETSHRLRLSLSREFCKSITGADPDSLTTESLTG